MFSSFMRSTDYVFVTDENDEPLFTETEFGVTSVFMRKCLLVELGRRPRGDRSDREFEAECGYAILARFAAKGGCSGARELRLYRVSIRTVDGEIVERCERIAEGRF
jgi:hypothetical protein